MTARDSSAPGALDEASGDARVEDPAARTTVGQTHPGVVFARVLAVVAVAAGGLAAIVGIVNGQTLADLVQQNVLTSIVVGSTFGVVGAVVIAQDARNALGWLFCVQGQLQCWSALSSQYAAHVPVGAIGGLTAFIGAYAWFPGMLIALTLTAPLFPNGRPPTPRWRPLLWIGVAVSAIGTIGVCLTDGPMRDSFPGYRNPIALPIAAEPALTVASEIVLVSAAGCAVAGIVGMIVRAATLTGRGRRQAIWLLSAFAVGVIAQTLDAVNPLIPTIAWSLFPIALGFAMTRHGLFDGDRLLNRTLVNSVLTVFVAAAFGIFAGTIGGFVGGAEVGAVLAAILIALCIDPIRRLAQRAVDRLLYGQRNDPFAAIESLGQRLTTSLTHDDALTIIVTTVTRALRLPYSSITLLGEHTPVACVGELTGERVDIPLVDGGSEVGVLTVGLRPGRRFLDPGDERLLTELARRAGAAAEAVRLNRELRRSRDAVIAARDEERHRIRRDLHDGLGPALAGVALGIGAAQGAIATADPETAELLSQLHQEVQGSLDEVKSLVADLRPTVLENEGLASALTRYCTTVTERSRGALTVTVTADIPALPAKVETAAYRIALEALTNVTRHSRAALCTVTASVVDGTLELRIADDGIGIASALPTVAPRGGLGLHSMSERAREQGGKCTIVSGADGGTVVEAGFPLEVAR
jgi:two-component system, NarL family, sensor kinase